jgi:hypothetical protein
MQSSIGATLDFVAVRRSHAISQTADEPLTEPTCLAFAPCSSGARWVNLVIRESL